MHNSLSFIASRTGGLALLNGQRVTALDGVRKDVESYYWLGFTPRLGADDERYEVAVEVSNPDLRVRTRRSYVDISPRTQVVMAIKSALLFGPSRSSDELNVEVGEFKKAGKGKMEAGVKVTIPTSALQFVPSEAGFTAQLVLVIAALDNSGGQSDVTPIPLVYSAARKPKSNDYVTYEAPLKVRRKTKRLAVAAYDANGGETYTRVIDL